MALPHDQYTEVNGLKIRYWDVGVGPCLLLVHGIGASAEYWYKNIEALSKCYRLIVVDLPGFGKSEKPDIRYDLGFFSTFLQGFLTVLAIDKVTLCGHSLGGGVVLAFAIQHVEKIKKIILVDNVGFSKQVFFFFRLMGLPFLGPRLLNFNRDAFSKILRLNVYDGKKITDQFINWIYPYISQTETKRTMLNITKYNTNLLGMTKQSLAPLWQGYEKLEDIPVLIFWGQQDRLLACHKHVPAAKNYLPHAKIHLFDQCGHIPQIEYTDVFNEVALDFIG